MAASLGTVMESRYNSIRRVSESQSEASSNATELSDHEIAARLGIDPSSVETVRFKVDRKKLEEMIQSEQAKTFFESLMKETTTQIYWPSHLKIDAKSKKDVHVKIQGSTEAIKLAKERVLQKLDARGSRVTMKMDISYNDHSSIIGTGGNNIKKIMDETSTHIHFPDSNIDKDKDKESKEILKRFNMMCKSNIPYSYVEGINKPLNNNKGFPMKSNQVSLNGTLEGVERARAAVRYTSPLTISFETPVLQIQKPSAATESDIEKVKQKFGVSVVLKSTRQKLHSTIVMVKGTEKNAKQVEQATNLLINSMCDTLANQTKVCLQMEISTQHHDSIKGVNGNNLRQIMEETQTTIIFPDCKDGNTLATKKTHVTIKGCLEGVYIAKQQLIGNLLITLSFDYAEFSLTKVDTDELSKKYGVLISARDKTKHGGKCISIKGKEKFIDKIYEARHELLKLTTPLIKADIPEAYFSKTDHDEFAFRQQLILMSNRAESPLTHYNLGQNFSPQFDAFQNVSRMQNLQNRQRINQNNFNNNFLSPHSSMSQRNSVSPTTPLTSGYNSAHNSFNSSSSLEQQINIFQQSQNPFMDRDSLLTDRNILFDEEKTPTLLDVKNSFNFEKKLEGYRAMKRSVDGDEVRTPTTAWTGLALSRTSPFSLETLRKQNSWGEHNETSPFNIGKTTSFFEAPNISPSNMLFGQHKDLESLLLSLGLEHYINTFHAEEIGLEMFATLTPEDLTTLGIQAFGARKKLLLAIHQLNEQKSNMSRLTKFSGSAAPGAERRISGDWKLN